MHDCMRYRNKLISWTLVPLVFCGEHSVKIAYLQAHNIPHSLLFGKTILCREKLRLYVYRHVRVRSLSNFSDNSEHFKHTFQADTSLGPLAHLLLQWLWRQVSCSIYPTFIPAFPRLCAKTFNALHCNARVWSGQHRLWTPESCSPSSVSSSAVIAKLSHHSAS